MHIWIPFSFFNKCFYVHAAYRDVRKEECSGERDREREGERERNPSRYPQVGVNHFLSLLHLARSRLPEELERDNDAQGDATSER